MTRTALEGGSVGTAGGASPASRRRRPFRGRHALTLLAFMAPAIVFVCWFTYWPMLQGARTVSYTHLTLPTILLV